MQTRNQQLHILDVGDAGILQQLLWQYRHHDRHVLHGFLALLRGNRHGCERGGLIVGGAGLLSVVGNPAAVVLGADTEVVLDDEVFGKPRDGADAAAMLRRLSGRRHRVLSAVSLVSPGREVQALSVSEVTFAALSDADIAAYVATGEPAGKAGGYAIQGGAELFITCLSGSYSGVMGLPLHEAACLLREMGLQPAAGSAGAVA